ncbi:MAG: putative diguanylate cyclase YdaM [Deltaproteobacteria bacterium ADurb.Bin510]|nr:MAG: putative diguanylate cyclase YdaM [Deltaproteobacteria bacterium ADurb.Bin510]
MTLDENWREQADAQETLRPLKLYTESLVGFLSAATLPAAFAGLSGLMAANFPAAVPVIAVSCGGAGDLVCGAAADALLLGEAERLLGRPATALKSSEAPAAAELGERRDLAVFAQAGEQVILSVRNGLEVEVFDEWVKILAPAVAQRLAAEQLKRLAYRDGLTGVFNRRAWQEMLAREAELASRYATPLSVIMLDIDWFKRINDGFGHQCGDNVLAGVAGVLGECCRKSDLVFRLGGDEFALLLPHTGIQAARTLAERICRCIGGREYGPGLKVSASIGVSEYQTGYEPCQIMRSADQGLYRAKAGGGNRVEIMKGVQ